MTTTTITQNPRVIDWTPSKLLSTLIGVASLVLTVVAIAAYAALHAMRFPGSHSFSIDARHLWQLITLAVGIMALTMVHELLHGLALRTLGHTARYGATLVGGVVPALYCTSPGARMSRTAFSYVALLPGIVLAVVPAVWILAGWPGGGWWVVPAGMLLGGAIGDCAMTARAWRSPRGTRVEDMRDGLRLYLP